MIGEDVRRRREELGLTGAQLAARAGMAPSAISQIETGKRMPSFISIVKLAEALGVSVGDLFPKGQGALPLDYFSAEAPLQEEVLFRQAYAPNDFDVVMGRAHDVALEARKEYQHAIVEGGLRLGIYDDGNTIEVRLETVSPPSSLRMSRVGRRRAGGRT